MVPVEVLNVTKLRTGQTLANKHRPRTWDDVCGHVSVVSRLKGMLKSQEIPNALLLAGPSGTGKTTLARVFSRYLNCEDHTACGECESCKAMDRQPVVHPDYKEIDAGSEGRIDDIRSVIQQAAFMPTWGDLRIIVIDEAQAILGGAGTALLKTLEEPPAHTLFILCTMDPQKLMAAMKGRCQMLELARVNPEAIADHLQTIAKQEGIKGVPEKAFTLIAESTGGQLRDALQALDAVRQVMAGQSKKLSDEALEDLVCSVIVDASGVTDDLVANKVLLYLHAVKIDGKSTIRAIMKALLDVQSPVAFANSLLFQNSYLIDMAVDPKHSSVIHAATNKQLVKLLNEHVDRQEGYGSKPPLKTSLAIQSCLVDLRQKLVMGGQEKPLMQTILAQAYQEASATV